MAVSCDEPGCISERNTIGEIIRHIKVAHKRKALYDDFDPAEEEAAPRPPVGEPEPEPARVPMPPPRPQPTPPVLVARDGRKVDTLPGPAPGLVFEDPPEAVEKRGRKGYAHLCRPLMEHPGRWVRVNTGGSSAMTSAAWSINKGNVTGMDLGQWEARHGEHDGAYHLWVRYVGPAR